MASNPPAACCATGFRHEGNPLGELKNVEGVNTYISRPKSTETPSNVVIIVSDIFGIYINSQLLADEFAANGYLALIPDILQGDALTHADMESGKVDLKDWIKNHQPTHIDPIMESTIQYARQELGAKRIAGAGYCFGAKYVCRFLKDKKLDVGYLAHPSFVSHEELGAITGPLTIAAAEIDQIFTTQLRHESEDILKKAGQPWHISLHGGVSHGFAVRTDLSNKSFKFAKEQAFGQALGWFNYYL
ncbi:hypothetical protein N7471_001769 [Penicillium samsonianum]|uniref:uncharacterized protein n=1 Tax=Penicillium samsonianum TaxID=1882272 RepID=UPI0025466090|nr:uncharacterized protein N7471_001769 [Penicillium samsonianum]KAJ6150570.1 hypothetical protein N7471_001769 [Penicillium samsonianum]